MTVRLPAAAVRSGAAVADLTLTLEDGSSARGELPLGRLTIAGEAKLGGHSFVALSLTPAQTRRTLGQADRLPLGYHHLRVEAGRSSSETIIIVAPRRCWEPGSDLLKGGAERGGAPSGDRRRARDLGEHAGPAAGGAGVYAADAPLRVLAGKQWGIFAPVYALRSRRDWGAGDLAELKALVEWTAEQNGSLVATLPLLGAAFGERADPSPYRPLSRLFWNEFFLAPEMAAEWCACEPARRLGDAPETQRRAGSPAGRRRGRLSGGHGAQAAGDRGDGTLLLRAGGRRASAGL